MRLPGPDGDAALGAYGLRLHGLARARDLLVPVCAEAPSLEVELRLGRGGSAHEFVDQDTAELRLRNGGEIVIDRRRGKAVFRIPHAIGPDELVHPYLAPAAAVMARWLGHESVHAGAFTADGRAWALIGERTAGKSSMLAWLAGEGFGIVCDDMLVVDGLTPLAGPRSIDLRPDAARRLGVGDPVGVTGARERWRVRLACISGCPRLGGWIFLDWGDGLGHRRLTPAECLTRLLVHRGVRLPPTRPESLIELASLPAWELRRPLGWDSLSPTAERLRELVAS